MKYIYVCVSSLFLQLTPSMHYCYTWTVGRKLDQSVFETQSSMISFLHIKNLKIANKNCLWLSKIQTEFWSLISSCSLLQRLFLINCPYSVTQLNYSWHNMSIKLQLHVLLWHRLDCTAQRHMWLWFGSCAKQGIQTDQSMMMLQKQLHFKQFCWRVVDDNNDGDKFVLGWQLQTNA